MTKVKSIWDLSAREEAVSLIKQGKPIAVFNRGVCAIWGDGENENFVSEILRIKGEKRLDRPLGSTFLADDFVDLVDENITPDVRKIFCSKDELISRLGSLSFLRVPLKPSKLSYLPYSIISFSQNGSPILQNWHPEGHKPAYLFVKLMRENGIKYPAVTSMNISGQPEIVDQNSGVVFSQDNKIPLFLIDPKDKGIVKGSYTIISITDSKIILIRDGNIPGFLFEQLLETRIDFSTKIESKFPQPEFPLHLFKGLTPKELRIAIIGFSKGLSVQRIWHIMRPNVSADDGWR